MFERIVWDEKLTEQQNADATILRLQELGVLRDGASLPHDRFEAQRAFVHSHFEIPWTAITPPMERTLYGISSVQQPPNIVAIGIFCGNTFVWNVGSACGPGKCYTAKHLVGTDIDVDAIKLARSNFTKLGAIGDVDILTEDGHTLLDRIDYPIDLLYLDANGPLPGTTGPGTKKIYLTLLQRAYSKIPRGGLVVAHDTTPDWFVRDAGCYLDYVRDSANFRLSVSIEPDDQGVEVSVK